MTSYAAVTTYYPLLQQQHFSRLNYLFMSRESGGYNKARSEEFVTR